MFYTLYSLCLCRWIFFYFCSEDEIVAQNNFEEAWVIEGRKVIPRRRNSFQRVGMAIKRNYYLSKHAEVVKLHIFADASVDTMCIVAHFRDQRNAALG